MASFAGYPFRWMADRGYFPLPARDQDGIPRLSGEVQMDSEADYKALASFVCSGDVRMGTGGYLGRVVIQRQKDPMVNPEQALFTPVRKGELGEFTAVMAKFTPRTSGRVDNRFRAEVQFILTSDEITP